MGEKVYKPIVKDGDHLIRSKDNPDRVRGLTRDENNQNPDIIEWEDFCSVFPPTLIFILCPFSLIQGHAVFFHNGETTFWNRKIPPATIATPKALPTC